MKSTIVVFLLIVCALPIAAQLDPGPDGLGIYADLDATRSNLVTAPGTVDVYLLATHPTGPVLFVWACGIRFTGNVFFLDIPEPVTGTYWVSVVDAQTVEVVGFPYPDLGCEQAPPVTPIVHLATLRWLVMDEAPCEFYLRDHEGWNSPPAYGVCTGPDILFNASVGSWDRPVFTINGPAPVPVEDETWSRVQAMFR